MSIDYFVSKGYVSKIPPAKDLAEKEWKESIADLATAEKELGMGGYKWATVKAYYAMFHAAKAVLFLIGLKERSHCAVGEILDVLSKDGKLESSYVNDFKAAMSSREGADYNYSYSKKSAGEIVSMAGEFAGRMENLMEKLKKEGV